MTAARPVGVNLVEELDMPDGFDFANDEAAQAFCPTPTSEQVMKVVDIAMLTRSLGVVVGAPGVGKSTALREAARITPGAVYCAMSAAHSSLPAVLRLVCDALGVAPRAGTDAMFDALCHRIEQGRVPVLLIDEAQFLNDRNLDVLRCLYDATAMPIVFAGNYTLRDRFNKSKAASFGQFTSRVGARADLKAATTADVEALARHLGVREPDAFGWLESWEGEGGGLRRIKTLLGLARGAAGEGDIGLDHLKQAAAMLEGAA